MLKPLPALAGSPVIHQDRVAGEMYIINSGRLQVWETPANGSGPMRARCSLKACSCSPYREHIPQL